MPIESMLTKKSKEPYNGAALGDSIANKSMDTSFLLRPKHRNLTFMINCRAINITHIYFCHLYALLSLKS